MLKSKQKQLKLLGKGNRPQEASSLTPEEIDVLFEKKRFWWKLSESSYQHSLVQQLPALWLMRCKEQRDLNWGDIVLKADSSGKQYLEYSTERQTKTRAGDNPLNRRTVKPRM